MQDSPPTAQFDPFKRAASPALRQRIAGLVAELLAHETAERGVAKGGKVRTEKFRLSVEALVCNFAVLSLIAPGRLLAIPVGNRKGAKGASDRSAIFGVHLKECLDALTAKGFIEKVASGCRSFADGKPVYTATTYTAKPRLLELIGVAPEYDGGLTFLDFCQDPHAPVLVMKGTADSNGNRQRTDFAFTGPVRRRTEQMREINSWLAKLPIEAAASDLARINGKSQHASEMGAVGALIDPTQRHLRRSFVDNDWRRGGRLYGGFWEIIPRDERRCIRLPGAGDKMEPLCNVDYGQLFPRLAYNRALASPSDADIYDINGDGSHRGEWKRLMNAMLFSEKAKLGGWPSGLHSLKDSGITLREAERLIREKHAAIAHLFGTGLGYELMTIESDLLVDILLVLCRRGIPALPLHDSVLVAESFAETVRTIMREELARRSPEGITPVVEVAGLA